MCCLSFGKITLMLLSSSVQRTDIIVVTGRESDAKLHSELLTFFVPAKSCTPQNQMAFEGPVRPCLAYAKQHF